MATVVLSAWMLAPGDRVDGKTVRYIPTYTDATKSHVRVVFADGTDQVYGHRDDVEVAP